MDYQLLNLEKSLEEVVADEVPGTTNDDRELLPQGETEEPKINNVSLRWEAYLSDPSFLVLVI